MATCISCACWITQRKTIYGGDGSEVVNFQAAEGKGACTELGIETPHDFGCNRFAPGSPTDQVVVSTKQGEPWQHFTSGPCPDCAGAGNSGDSGCHRCAGTGKVRHYDDGYVGEERTRMHPKEKELNAKPACVMCGQTLERDWIACPKCGHRKEKPAKTEVVPLEESLHMRG